MIFSDRALVALANDANRGAVLSPVALRNIVLSSYSVTPDALQGAATPVYASFVLGGLDPEGVAVAEPQASNLRIDALWRGDIRISASFPTAQIASVTSATLPVAALDAAVAAVNGGVLPADPMALETARRAVLLERLAALLNDPAAATDAVLDRWLDRAGVDSVADLLAAPGTASLAALQLAFSAPLGGTAFSQMDFPVAVAVVIRDPGLPGASLAGIIGATCQVQAALRLAGFQPRHPSEAGGQGRACVALVVPETWFDDDDWPGLNRAARINTASQWMAREGIALAPAAV